MAPDATAPDTAPDTTREKPLKRPYSARLKVKVNPTFDHDLDPDEQGFTYTNPVAINNEVIRLSNEMTTLAGAQGDALRAIAKLRLEKGKLERAQEDVEERLLRDHPLAPSEAKSNKTIAAAIARRVLEAGLEEEFVTRRATIREIEDRIADHQATVDIAALYWKTADKLCTNCQTHLSWLKKELETSRRGGGYGA